MMAIRFDYPIQFTTLPDYSEYRGQMVEVIRQCTNDECDPECQPMYWIRAKDGWKGVASLDELTLLADM